MYPPAQKIADTVSGLIRYGYRTKGAALAHIYEFPSLCKPVQSWKRLPTPLDKHTAPPRYIEGGVLLSMIALSSALLDCISSAKRGILPVSTSYTDMYRDIRFT